MQLNMTFATFCVKSFSCEMLHIWCGDGSIMHFCDSNHTAARGNTI